MALSAQNKESLDQVTASALAHLRDVMEGRFDNLDSELDELALLAAAIEALIHGEATGRLAKEWTAVANVKIVGHPQLLANQDSKAPREAADIVSEMTKIS